jgi:hypothetical protein
MLGKKNNILRRQRIAIVLPTVSSNNFQFVSATHELNAILFQLAFKPTPIVAGLRIIRLIVDGRTTSVAENHRQLFASSQTAITSRSLKNRIGFLLIFFIRWYYPIVNWIVGTSSKSDEPV